LKCIYFKLMLFNDWWLLIELLYLKMTKFYRGILFVVFAGCCNFLSAQSPAYIQRKADYISTCLAAPSGSKLILQAYQGVPLNNNTLNNELNEVTTNSTADFTIIELVRLLFLTNGEYDSQILPVLNSIPYWINYGDTMRNYWSENHMIMWMSSDWLLHEKYGRAIDANLENRLKHYLQLKVDYGFYEFFSSVYGPYSFSGLVNLADFSQDIQIKTLATQACQRLLKDFLKLTNDKGVYYPTAGRNYPGKYENPYNQNHNNLIYLLTGLGNAPNNASAAGPFLASSTLPVDDIINSWAPVLDTVYYNGHTLQQGFALNANQAQADKVVFQWSSGGYFHPDVVFETVQLLNDSNMWDHPDFGLLRPLSFFPDTSFPAMSQALGCISQSTVIAGEEIAIYKHHAITLSSLQNFWPGKVGFQQYPCVANVGTTAVYCGSGTVYPNWDDRSPNNQNTHLPYVEQHKNLALLMYRPEPTPDLIGPSFAVKDVALYFNDSDFDEIAEDSLWILGREAEGYVAVRRSCINTINGVRACNTNVGQSWVIMVGDSGLYGNFTNFKNTVHQSTFTEDWYYDYADSQYVYYAQIIMDGDTIEHAWGVDSTLATGVNELIADNGFKVYPNPAADLLHISTNNLKGNGKIELYNISGQQVFSYTGTIQNIEIPVHNLTSGLYAVKLTGADGKIYSRKIIIGH
jgi:hypothetical protein